MRYSKKNLDNGINLGIVTGLSQQSVTISAFLKAGCRFDPIDKPGLAHFTEHMAFSKTKSYKNSQILAKTIEQYGGLHSAFTWIDHQAHVINLPKDYFKIGARVLSETIFKLVIEDSEIEKEKGVIKEEILRNKSDPSKAIWDYVWFPLFFQDTHLARPYSGEEKDISSITNEDIKFFTSQYFTPQNVVLFVAGDIDRGQIYNFMNKYFGQVDAKNRKEELLSIVANHKNNHTFLLENEHYQQSAIMIGVKTVPFKSSLKYIFNIIREMLAGYSGSPLIYRLREEGGLIYGWKAIHDSMIDTGYLCFKVTTAHENVPHVLDIILTELKRFEEGNFSNSEVEMAKNHLIGSLLVNIERGRDYIQWYGLQELLYSEKVIDVDEAINHYKNISLKEIKNVASEYLSNKNILIGTLGKSK